MSTPGVKFPTDGNNFPVRLIDLVDDGDPANTMKMTAVTNPGGPGVLFTISFVSTTASIETDIPNPLADDYAFFNFKTGSQIQTYFDNAKHKAEIITFTTLGNKAKVELEFQLFGKIGGAGENATFTKSEHVTTTNKQEINISINS